MNHHYRQAPGDGQEYIRTILLVEDIALHDPLPMFPQGTPALICLVSDFQSQVKEIRLWLFNKTIRPELFAGFENYTLACIFFRPFVMNPLFGIPAREQADAPMELANWNAKKAQDLCERLSEAKTMDGCMNVIHTFLKHLILKNGPACEILRVATDRMVEEPAADIFPTLLEELQVTERTLQRVFKKYMGVSPNQFRRLCQFYSAFHQIRNREFDQLSDVAYEQGYADQSHFIRSFREFTRKNPGEYLKRGLSDPKN